MVLAGLWRGVSIKNWETPTWLLVMGAIGVVFTWHSAGADLERLFVPLMVRLGLLLSVLFAVDAWLAQRRGAEEDS